MNINYTARNTKIALVERKYCERRLKSIEKLLGYGLEADLVISVEKHRNVVEINLKTKRGTLNTVEETNDMLSSLGIAFDNIERRVKKESIQKITKGILVYLATNIPMIKAITTMLNGALFILQLFYL